MRLTRCLSGLPRPLGSTNPCASGVHMEPFPSSAFKVLILIFATTTKIRTDGRFARARALGFEATAAPSYSSRPGPWPDGRMTFFNRCSSSRHGYRVRNPDGEVIGLVFLGACRAEMLLHTQVTHVARGRGYDNDPSAGSPTETLLRLLLPLNDKVQWTSRYVAGSEPPTSERSEHFIGPFNRLATILCWGTAADPDRSSRRGSGRIKTTGRRSIQFSYDNDPSAGSPTETLLRLLLPLNENVQWTSRYVAGSEPPTSERSEHFTGPFNRSTTATTIRALQALLRPATRGQDRLLGLRDPNDRSYCGSHKQRTKSNTHTEKRPTTCAHTRNLEHCAYNPCNKAAQKQNLLEEHALESHTCTWTSGTSPYLIGVHTHESRTYTWTWSPARYDQPSNHEKAKAINFTRCLQIHNRNNHKSTSSTATSCNEGPGSFARNLNIAPRNHQHHTVVTG
ncbi:hypothetical protein F511_39260 [Dorcoceras hygrometricum]|uniref:Uncharacterized protein n=1 Tax=Dorcoceras hygrometricum TaxID=472368 RepID=A0A2Z7CR22_9LAMI|nr:hypothetical protein F511_39260 [Dorcoceras hygrometricum]